MEKAKKEEQTQQFNIHVEEHDTEPKQVNIEVIDTVPPQETKNYSLNIVKPPPFEMMEFEKIKLKPVFSELFDRPPEIHRALVASLKKDGYRMDKPLILWGDTLTEGHQRYFAALEAGIKHLPVIRMDFENEQAAVDFAIKEQVDRRNLKTVEEIRLVTRILPAEQEQAKQRQKVASSEATCGKAAEKVAQRLHISASMVEKIIRLINSGDKALLKRVESDELTVSGACKKLSEANKKKEPVTDKGKTAEARPGTDTVEKQEPLAIDEIPEETPEQKQPGTEAETEPAKEDAQQERPGVEEQTDIVHTTGNVSDGKIIMLSPGELRGLLKKIPSTDQIPVPECFYNKLKEMQKEPLELAEIAIKDALNSKPKKKNRNSMKNFFGI